MRKITLLLCLAFFTFYSSSTRATVHTIYLSCVGIVPDSTTANCGDTINWIWNGCTDSLKSTSIPGCAFPWNTIVNGSNTSYSIIVPCAGAYYYKCDGHIGKITVSCVAGVPLSVAPPSLSFTIYPNPTKGNTNVAFTLAQSENVSLEIYDILGERVYSVNENKMMQGSHLITVDGTNLSAGIYFVKLTSDSGTITKRLVIEK
jgi:plastocyanin